MTSGNGTSEEPQKEETALVRREEPVSAVVPRTFEELEKFADTIAKSDMVNKELRRSSANVIVTMQTGMELGFGVMGSVRAINVIEGTPQLKSDAMVNLCMRHPQCEYFRCIETTLTQATYETERAGYTTQYTFTMEEAKLAGKIPAHPKSNWFKVPRNMLRARAASNLARMVYPDALFGCYTADEMSADDRYGAENIIEAQEIEAPPLPNSPSEDAEAEVVEEAPTEPPPQDGGRPSLVDRIHAATSVAGLNRLGEEAAGIDKGSALYTAVRAAYKEQLNNPDLEPLEKS